MPRDGGFLSYASFYMGLFYLCYVTFPDQGVIWVNSSAPPAQAPGAVLQTVNNGTTPAGPSGSSRSRLAWTEGHFLNHKWQLHFQNVVGWEVRSPGTSTAEASRSGGREPGARALGRTRQMNFKFLPGCAEFWRKEEEGVVFFVFLAIMKERKTFRHEILFSAVWMWTNSPDQSILCSEGVLSAVCCIQRCFFYWL